MIELLNGALTFNRSLMERLRDMPDVVRRGLLLVLFVGVVVGLVQGTSSAITTLTPEQTIDNARRSIDAGLDAATRNPAFDPFRDIIAQIDANKEPALAIVEEILRLPTPLPAPLAVLLQILAVAVTTPLGYLSQLLFAVILTHIAARQLGGVGSIQQMVGLGALSVAPRMLDALSFVPWLGGFLSILAFFWGLAVLMVATSVVHRLAPNRTALAVLLYPFLLFTLFAVVFCCIGPLIFTALTGV